MTNTNNKHLVSAGHELAATMTADTPIIEIAKLVTRLATALDVQTALVAQLTEQRDAVVAENAHTRERHYFIRALAVSILEHSGGRMDWRGAMEDASELLKTVDGVYAHTPATDAVRTSKRVEGVLEFAAKMAAQHEKLQSGGFFDRQVDIYARVSEMAKSFARQLRESRGAQG